MRSSSKETTKLGHAAVALDEELGQFERLAASAQALSLDSQKNIERAAVTCNQAGESQARLGQHIHAFMAALTEAREQNERTATALQARAQEIQKRGEELGELLGRFGALGAEAKQISATVLELGQKKAGPDQIAAIEERMTALVETARALHADAKTRDFMEVVAQVDALRQQVQSARNKVKLLLERLRPP